MNIFVVFIMLALFVATYIITYMLNKKVEAPYVDIDMGGCASCQSGACGHNPANKD